MATKKIRRGRIYLIAILVILAGGALAFFLRPSSKAKESYRTATVQRGAVTATVSATGTLQPLTTIEVKSNVGGTLTSLEVDEGERVYKGDLIATIDKSDSQTSYNQQNANLAAARAKVKQAKAQRDMQGKQSAEQVHTAQAALDAANLRLAQAQAQAKLQPELTKSSIAQAQSSYNSAKAALQQVKTVLIPQKKSSVNASVDQAQGSVDQAQESLNQANASIDQAQANLAVAKKDLDRQTKLNDKGFVPASTVETSQQKFDVAQAQLKSAQAQLSSAQVQLKTAQSQLKNAQQQAKTIEQDTEADLDAAQARVDQAKAALDNANANSAQNNIKDQDVTAAKAQVKQAEAALASAKAGIMQDDIRAEDIVQAEASATNSQAALKNAYTQLGYTTITAPRSGVVIKKYVDEGSIISAGRSASGSGAGFTIVDIADTTRMFVTVNIDETDIAQISVKQSVDITIDAYPDELFEGKVTKIAPQAATEQNITTIPVTVEVEMPDARLKPGMNATCEFITSRKDDVMFVPNEAIKDGENGSTVQVMVAGKPVSKEVEVGLAGNDATEIISGLQEGETVVTATVSAKKAGTSSGTSGGGAGGPRGGMRPF